jgi:hypothetical protein
MERSLCERNLKKKNYTWKNAYKYDRDYFVYQIFYISEKILFFNVIDMLFII